MTSEIGNSAAVLAVKANVDELVKDRTFRGEPASEHWLIRTALKMLTPDSGVCVDNYVQARTVKWGVLGMLEGADPK